MRYRIQDANGDYTFGQAQSNFYINQVEAVQQAILTSLYLFQNEWFLDLTVGMPWAQKVIGPRTQGLYDQAIQNCILGVEGVTGIASYSSVLNTKSRALSVSAQVSSLYGLINLSGVSAINYGYGLGPYGEGPYGDPQ